MINCCNCYRTDGKRNDCYYHIQAMTATLSLEYAAIVVSVLYRMLTDYFPIIISSNSLQVLAWALFLFYADLFRTLVKLMSVPTKSRDLSRHTIEEKIEAVRQRIFQESSFRELQERHGICSATLSVWIKKYKAEVLRRFPVKDLPLYVLKYQETMTTEEENELTRLRRENEDLKLLHEANLLMIDMAKERFGIDIKKNYEEMLLAGLVNGKKRGREKR